MTHRSFHIQAFGPTTPWPNGGWSLFEINGDQIAERIVRNDKGKVIERHSWCGYVGIFATLPELMAAIDKIQGPTS